MSTDTTEPRRMTRGEYLKLRALRRAAHAERCSVQAKAAKAELIEKGKGRNGRSMSQSMVEAHFGIF